jgi:serine phosphatase RsbU (regulator of sigma subunit)
MDPKDWFELTDAMLRDLARLQDQLLRSSRQRLEAAVADAQRSVLLWVLLLVAGSSAVAATGFVVHYRIVRPLELMTRSMRRLADDDLSMPVPRLRDTDEVGVMAESLRIFKANAIRRQRLEREKDALHVKLAEAHTKLNDDLTAAAAIQAALLPSSGTLCGVRYDSLFRPARLIAGDTYAVTPHKDGRVGFFAVDVAGHGAAAALVSVAAHHTLSQALVRRGDGPLRTVGDRLEALVAQVNADWPEGLPYFTMILGEIEPGADRGVVVQAGHPLPLLIRNEGQVHTIGQGGLPVGLLASSTYETTEFAFYRGDRLMLYSDGLSEAENAEGVPFSDERIETLIRQQAGNSTTAMLAAIDAALLNWRRSDSFEDDVTVLVLERTG